MTLYVLDTSIWVHVWRQHPPDIYVSVWERLQVCVEGDEIRSPEDVRIELERGTDGLAEHIGSWSGLYVPVEEIWDASQQVAAKCPSLSDEASDRNRADPFVVALGLASGGTVVTKETRRKANTGRMKIPDACDHLGVSCLDWFSFLRNQGWKL